MGDNAKQLILRYLVSIKKQIIARHRNVIAKWEVVDDDEHGYVSFISVNISLTLHNKEYSWLGGINPSIKIVYARTDKDWNVGDIYVSARPHDRYTMHHSYVNSLVEPKSDKWIVDKIDKIIQIAKLAEQLSLDK